MSPPPAESSESYALTLHQLLIDIDPSRWKQTNEEAFRQRVRSLAGTGHRLLSEQTTGDVADSIRHTLETLEEDAPPPGLAKRQARAAWKVYCRELTAAYEDLSISLRDLDVRVPSLRPTNLTRSTFHVFMASMAVLVLEIMPTWEMLVASSAAFFFGGWGMEITRRRSRRVNKFLMGIFARVAHPHETYRINSATWYATALFTMAVIDAHLANFVGLVVLGVGDPVAALVGRRFGRTPLVHGRSLEGTSAFVVVGTLMSFVALSVVHHELPRTAVFAASLSGATAGAAAELFSRRLDDNLTVPLSATLAAGLAWWFMGVPLWG